MHVSEDKGLYHCFGCGSKGDALTLIQSIEGVSFRKALEMLRAGYPSLALPVSAEAVKHSSVQKLPCPLDPLAEGQTLLEQVLAYYHQCLLRSPEAMEYLRRRGIGS